MRITMTGAMLAALALRRVAAGDDPYRLPEWFDGNRVLEVLSDQELPLEAVAGGWRVRVPDF